ncbi:hypothetical protein GWD52_17615 [Enterobacteriaceae bacterium 4M9]|nr:hypothetical protein [Enterobacteriaceae bacterium 4M9]
MAIFTNQVQKLTNIWCWLLIIMPYTVRLIWLDALTALILRFALVTIFVVLDRRALAEAGLRSPHLLWGVLLEPVYLWKRDGITGYRFKRMFVMFFIIRFMMLIMAYYYEDIHAERNTCAALNTLNRGAQAQRVRLGGGCERVIDIELVEAKKYNADVRLKNGSTMQVGIQLKNNGQLIVRAPFAYQD